jgi:hypothetical protein
MRTVPFTDPCHRCRRRFPMNELREANEGGEVRSYCLECRLLRGRERRVETERKSRLAKLGVTIEEYDRLLARQGGVCAICRRDRPGKAKRMLAVDHCHRTGRVRGLLCMRCNTTLSAIGDSVSGIQRFIDYLLGAVVPPRRSTRGRKHSGLPFRVRITRYVMPDGKRVPKGTPGASHLRALSDTFYANLGGHRLSLGTTDQAEAVRRLGSLREAQRITLTPDHVPALPSG